MPALFFGCSPDYGEAHSAGPEEPSEITVRLRSSSDPDPEHTDVFIFNDDSLRRIDAYQRVEGSFFKAASRVGEKIMVAIANSAEDSDSWRRISSYDGLMEEIALLEDEDPDHPLMSGEERITAGDVSTCELELTRLMSQIHLRTLCADFHTTEFDGEPLRDVKVYLTNVNASCAIMKWENFRPEMIVNQGYADFTAMGSFSHSEMLWREVPFDLTSSATDADISLCCYPNDTPEETYGSPYTRLVIEGTLMGITCYYPITVNREENGVCYGGDGSGIGRNCRYNFDITLCRFGTSDPDTPVSKGDVIVNCTVEPWTDMGSQTITF